MSDHTTKRCTKCGNSYPATPEYFSRNKTKPGGINSQCKICTRADGRQRKRDPQKRRDSSLKYARTHKEEIKLRSRDWIRKNPDKKRAQMKRYRDSHHDERQKNYRAWYANNKDKNREKQHRREARKRLLPATLTNAEWEQIKTEWDYSCAYCGKRWFEIDTPLQQEHVIPIVQGGGYTADNIVPACGSCNSQKNGRTPEQAGMKLRKNITRQ